ncbi:hypothetical protein HAX54_051954 [Datura stramonium]|uniref:Uncharacterized protein n=1 Tax=Datura stramonium TaxID=4076 RepID=A0ABS8SZA0_DATST|nr:hypothetical protein [Datura stramonium]
MYSQSPMENLDNVDLTESQVATAAARNAQHETRTTAGMENRATGETGNKGLGTTEEMRLISLQLQLKKMIVIREKRRKRPRCCR